VGVFAFTTVGSRHKQHSWLLRGTSAPIKYRENTPIKSTDRSHQLRRKRLRLTQHILYGTILQVGRVAVFLQ
jgi:hypothetical protein